MHGMFFHQSPSQELFYFRTIPGDRTRVDFIQGTAPQAGILKVRLNGILDYYVIKYIWSRALVQGLRCVPCIYWLFFSLASHDLLNIARCHESGPGNLWYHTAMQSKIFRPFQWTEGLLVSFLSTTGEVLPPQILPPTIAFILTSINAFFWGQSL